MAITVHVLTGSAHAEGPRGSGNFPAPEGRTPKKLFEVLSRAIRQKRISIAILESRSSATIFWGHFWGHRWGHAPAVIQLSHWIYYIIFRMSGLMELRGCFTATYSNFGATRVGRNSQFSD